MDRKRSMFLDFNERDLEMYFHLSKNWISIKKLGLKKETLDQLQELDILDKSFWIENKKCSILEFIWIKIVLELNKYQLSKNSLLKIESVLLDQENVQEVFTLIKGLNFERYDFLSEEEIDRLKVFAKLVQSFLSEGNEVVVSEMLAEIQNQFSMTVLASLVYQTIFERRNIVLQLSAEGDVDYIDFSKLEFNSSSPIENKKSYISIPIVKLLTELVEDENEEMLTEFTTCNILSKEELKVIQLLRKEKLTSLSVKLDNDKNIKLIEVEEEIDIRNINGKLTDYIMRNQYQEINYKTQNGKISSVRRKTKYKT